MVTAVFKKCDSSETVSVSGLWQYDYGQVLRIQGLSLPAAVEVHFSLTETDGDAVTRIGVTSDGVTDVTIPDSMLENGDTGEDYSIYAYVYVVDDDSGETVYKINLLVRARSKPEALNESDEDLYATAVALINAAANTATKAATLAESWAVGGTDTRDGEDEDNAKFYSKLAMDALASIAGKILEARKEIDSYVDGKEAELKGDTGDVYFTCFKVIDGRLYMYTNSEKIIEFYRVGSRLYSRIAVAD